MKASLLFAVLITLAYCPLTKAEETHLFILSGQSNMAGLNPNVSFTPTVTQALAGKRVIVVKDAQGGQPIRRWHKAWKPVEGDQPQATGDLYDRLMKSVKKSLGNARPDSITFVWMQGERDAREGHGSVYANSLLGVIDQLEADLKFKPINVVVGRLSDFESKAYPDWDTVRKAQIAVGTSSQHAAWVDTDDLNGPKNALHYTKKGYAELGKRFADAALQLLAEK